MELNMRAQTQKVAIDQSSHSDAYAERPTLPPRMLAAAAASRWPSALKMNSMQSAHILASSFSM